MTYQDKIQKMLKNNRKINPCFHPIIEEFLIRLIDQYHFTETEFDEILKKYDSLGEIRIGKANGMAGIYSYHYDIDKVTKQIVIGYQFITFDKDYLKQVMLGNREIIEEFINTAFHEQGHFIQLFQDEPNSMYNGLKKSVVGKDQYGDYLYHTGTMINEFAEVINAERLTRGNLGRINYDGYITIQKMGKAMLASLGISEIEFSDLQMKTKGRSEYEKRVQQVIGKENMKCLITLEDCLDTINAIAGRIAKIAQQEGGRTTDEMAEDMNLAEQIKTFTSLTSRILEIRFEKLGSEPNIEELTKILMDKEKRDENLQNMLLLYKEITPRNLEQDIKPEMDVTLRPRNFIIYTKT